MGPSPPHRDGWRISFLVVISIVPMFMLVGTDFINQDDQSEFEIVVKTPDGTSLAGTTLFSRKSNRKPGSFAA